MNLITDPSSLSGTVELYLTGAGRLLLRLATMLFLAYLITGLGALTIAAMGRRMRSPEVGRSAPAQPRLAMPAGVETQRAA